MQKPDKHNISWSLLQVSTAISLLPVLASCGDKQPERPNILLICVDDLRPELGCYGNKMIRTPNLDRLAAQGVLFNHHYANVPTCGASRYNLLTGLLPRNRVQDGNEAIRRTISGRYHPEKNPQKLKPTLLSDTTLPESFIHYLHNQGYYTVGIGKISHYSDGYLYGYNQPQGTQLELPRSWDEWMLETGRWGTGWNAFFGYADGSNRNTLKHQVKPYECGDVDDEGYPDGLMARRAVEKLRELGKMRKFRRFRRFRRLSNSREQPFLLAVGFFRPHLPFNSPEKYWDLYNEDQIPLTPVPGIPEGINRASLHNSGEFNNYALGEEKASLDHPLSDAYARKIRHAYFAAVSYADAQIGKVLDELKRLGLDNNTIVVVWGDHGWHLGDHRVWGKHTLFEWALRSALIMRVPKQYHAGVVANEVVSTVDIYPTLMDLCGLEMPYKGDGKSFAALFSERGLQNPVQAAYGFFRQGITLRTERYRVTRYFRKQQPVIELYDQLNDPYETVNIAGDYPELVDSLMSLAPNHFTTQFFQ
ncbi:MAG: sulfatase [Bacteroidales bacterium]|nr:sulfatase [Bacteroidales bacterium]